jgi:Amt family ammonium transporter
MSQGAVLSSRVINGGLGGLVGITAGAATMDPGLAVVTGLVGGMLATKGNDLSLRLQLDDVVGAVAVHGFAGAWGTLAAGMFYADDPFNLSRIMVQLVGIGVAFIWGFGVSWILFGMLNLVAPMRTSSRHEQRGMDYTEHGEIGYSEFQQVLTHAESRD